MICKRIRLVGRLVWHSSVSRSVWRERRQQQQQQSGGVWWQQSTAAYDSSVYLLHRQSRL